MNMLQPYGLSLLSTYPYWWEILLTVGVASFVMVGLLYRLAMKRVALLPKVRDRDVHTVPKPRVGGVAMWLVIAVALSLLATGILDGKLMGFGGISMGGIDRALWGILIGMVVLLGFGLYDDMKSLSPVTQLLGQFLAATAAVWGGIQVPYVRVPFLESGMIRLDGTSFILPGFLGGGEVLIWGALFTYLWVLTMINVMNFFDGLDGLAGSVGMTAATVLFFVCLRLGLMAPATLALIVVGATAGFLPWNWHPSKLFMGTVGSQVLGFLLAVIAVVSGAKVATAVLVLGMPVLDALIVVVRRLLAGSSPLKADQRHLHHRLLKIGLSTPQVVILINVVAVTFGYLALRTQDSQGKGMLSLILVACMTTFIIITYLLERRAVKRVH